MIQNQPAVWVNLPQILAQSQMKQPEWMNQVLVYGKLKEKEGIRKLTEAGS